MLAHKRHVKIYIYIYIYISIYIYMHTCICTISISTIIFIVTLYTCVYTFIYILDRYVIYIYIHVCMCVCFYICTRIFRCLDVFLFLAELHGPEVRNTVRRVGVACVAAVPALCMAPWLPSHVLSPRKDLTKMNWTILGPYTITCYSPKEVGGLKEHYIGRI